jgi:uncharacterized protein YggE
MTEPAQLAVVGEGTATGVPDRCIVHASLNAMAESVADAVSRVAVLASQVSESLRASGLDPADIRTTNINVNDLFEQTKQKVTARVASYQLEITVRELDKLGEHLAGLVSVAGDALQVRGLQLTIADFQPLIREARIHAMTDARNKAVQLAEAAGLRLERIVSIEEGSSARGIPFQAFGATRLMSGAGAATAAQIHVEPGSLSVSSGVAVTFELSE